MFANWKKPLDAFIYAKAKFSESGAPIIGNNIVEVLHNSVDSEAVARARRKYPVQRIDVTIKMEKNNANA